MRGFDLFDKLSLVDAQYVNEAETAHPRRARLFRYAAAAAALVLCVLAALPVLMRQSAPVIIDEGGFYIKDGVLESYSGSDTDVVLPDAVTAVADYAFQKNASRETIATVTLGRNVKSVGANAFAGLDALMELILADENTAFIERDGAIFTFDGSMLVRYEDREATAYTLPDGVRYIAAHAFQRSSLVEVVFPDTLEYIGYNAFAGCKLTAINLPESIVRVEEGAFASCRQAVDGYIPMDAELGNEAFEGVPFFLSQIAGHISPLEQIVRGQIMPTEAIALSNRENLLGQLDAILAYYRDGTEPSGDYARLHIFLDATLPEGAVLPVAADFAALRFRDSGWGGTGIHDIELRLPLGENATMVCEAYLYGGASDLLDWEDAVWRVETVTFVTKTAEGAENFGDWRVTKDGNVLVFYNSVTDAVARAALPIRGDYTYEINLSPDGNRALVEYWQGDDWYFQIHSLDGETFLPSMNTYADYMNRYFGKYTHGTLTWKDNDTVAGENEFGSFEFDPHELYPRQLTDYRRAYREDVLVTRTLLTVIRSMREETVYTVTVPETWVGDSTLEDIRRMETSPENATRMTGGLCDRTEEVYKDGAWNVTGLSICGMLTADGEIIRNDAGVLILHGTFAESETEWYSAAVLADDRVFIGGFTVYPEDPDDYYTRVILPVIESVRAEMLPNLYTGVAFRYSAPGIGIDGPASGFEIEGIRFVGGRTLATLAAEDGTKIAVDVTAALPYDADREGEQLLRADVTVGDFEIRGDTLYYVVYGGDGDTITPLCDVSALWK